MLESKVLFGQMGPPAILGGYPLSHLNSMKKSIGVIDYGLHVLKALMAQLTELIEARPAALQAARLRAGYSGATQWRGHATLMLPPAQGGV